MSDYEKLTDREIDTLMAERVMGWRVERHRVGDWLYPPDRSRMFACDGEAVTSCQFAPSWNDNAARLVRDRIAELGIVDRWAMQLDRIVWELPQIDPDMTLSSEPASLMRYMQATPRQQCIAALMAVEAKP